MSQLGLIGVTASDEVRFRTITRTRLRGLAPEQQVPTLRELYRDNAGRLARAIDFCLRKNIHLYRIPSGLFPQSEERPGYDLVEELAPQLGMMGARATEQGLRLVMHPELVVLNSDSKSAVTGSVENLRQHARVLDLLGQPRTAWAAIQIHGGKSGRADQLVKALQKLPEDVRSRLVLENDEEAYSAADVLNICRRAGIPMVFDVHHHICREGLASYDDPTVDELTRAARETWPDPSWQLVHISNGRDSFADPKHSDYIDAVPDAFREVEWIEVDARQKEQAVARLRTRLGRQWAN
ncbi:MAG TPA: UV damage endonuclease UvsE [Thermoanaerobaculia bacterium]|nr:UV damage endonuclease UvsE [Thermoanaerobaculia bacterium]